MYISLRKAIKYLQNSGTVAFPTETVYGLGAIALYPKAIEKIFKAKNRPKDNPLICHFYSLEQIKKYVPEVPLPAQLLLKKFSPGPLSILLSIPKTSPLLAATLGKDAVICRIPDHPLALEIIKRVELPLAAPSANTSGKMSGTTAEMVERDLGSKIDGVVDGGPCRIGVESTIVDGRSDDKIIILRPGIIGKQEIKRILTEAYRSRQLVSQIKVIEASNKKLLKEVVPGIKYRHYAPRTPIFKIKNIDEIAREKSDLCAFIGTREQFEAKSIPCVNKIKKDNCYYLCLGSRNNLEEIVKNLYYTFFILDDLNVSKAYFVEEEWGKTSLAKALNNRLQKVLQEKLS